MKALPASLVLTALAVPAMAQDSPPREAGPVACLPAQTVVPPFNNTPGAMEQSQRVATIVMDGAARRGGKAIPVCQTSPLTPQISEAEGVNEVPVDPDYEPDTAPE